MNSQAAPPSSALERLVGSTIDGKYRLERLLGRGGMGAVFRAVHLGTDRTVALKVIVPAFADRPDFLARFEREARACGRLRHPNIVDVTDFGYDEVDGRRLAYLVMEYLDGCSLADVLREGPPLPVAWVSDVLEQAGSALEEAHRAGILHRDLKPDNIWLEPNRRGGYTVKVLDFGLAKLGSPTTADNEPLPPVTPTAPDMPAFDEDGATLVKPAATRETPSVVPGGAPGGDATGDPTRGRPIALPQTGAAEVTALGAVVGTPTYMSPEQCLGQALSPRSDVYSLGVIAYRLLGGRLPFAGPTEELLLAHVSKPPAPLRELRPKLAEDAAEIVMRALSKSPEERPASAGAFAEMFAARAQTSREFLRSALLMYLEHTHAFLSTSIVALSPVLALGLLATLNALAFVYGIVIIPQSAGAAFVVSAILLTVGPGLLLVQGAVVPAVMQAVVAPLQPIDVGSLRRRFQPRLLSYLRSVAPLIVLFVATALWQVASRPAVRALLRLDRDASGPLSLVIGLLVVLLPNLPLLLWFLVLARMGSIRSFQFIAAVAVVEGLSPRDTLRRAAVLAVSSPASLRAARLAIVSAVLAVSFAGAFGFGLLARSLPPEVALGCVGVPVAIALVLLSPLLALISALSYLRARRAIGEPLDRALEEFERAVLPASHWALAARERVATLIASKQ